MQQSIAQKQINTFVQNKFVAIGHECVYIVLPLNIIDCMY